MYGVLITYHVTYHMGITHPGMPTPSRFGMVDSHISCHKGLVFKEFGLRNIGATNDKRLEIKIEPEIGLEPFPSP